MKIQTFAIDFDGTCVTHEFPRVGQDIGARYVLKALHDQGHKLVLNTMRSDGRDGDENPNPLSDALKWWDQIGVLLHGVNHNPDQDSWTSSPKVYAHMYIDDAALGAPLITKPGHRPFIDWLTVLNVLVVGKHIPAKYFVPIGGDIVREVQALPIGQILG